MPLNLEPRIAEDFLPFIKWNGNTGRWFKRNADGADEEVKDLTAIFDLENIKVGWILYVDGAGPVAQWDNGAMGQQPSPKHRRGFAVNVFSPQKLDGLREYKSISNVAIVSIKELYASWEAAPESRQGLVPVVQSTGYLPVKAQKGTNYQPTFKILKWVPRPADLPGRAMLPPPQQQAQHPQVPPPISSAGAAAQPAENDQEEF